jgi:hypothetical protein
MVFDSIINYKTTKSGFVVSIKKGAVKPLQ